MARVNVLLKVIVVLCNFFCLWTFIASCYYTAHTQIYNYLGSVTLLALLTLTYAVFLIADMFFMNFYLMYWWLRIITVVAAILSNIAAHLLTHSLYMSFFSVITIGNAFFAMICFLLHCTILSNPSFRTE